MEIRERLAEADPASVRALRDLAISYQNIGDIQMQLGNIKAASITHQKALKIREQRIKTDPSSIEAKQDVLYSYRRTATVLWKQEKPKQAAEKYVQALNIAPENLSLLSNDMELAWTQGDTTRCQERINSLNKLLKPDQPRYTIVRLYAWLAAPEQSWQPVLQAIETAGDGNRISWEFSATIPKVQELPESQRRSAEAFIAYFEAKINLKELRQQLDELRVKQK